jgi:hypothetical protein
MHIFKAKTNLPRLYQKKFSFIAFLLSFKIAVPTALKADSISWHRTRFTNVKEWKKREVDDR